MAVLDKNIKCTLINIQSVGNKTIKIRNLIIEQDIDICFLTETWLYNNTGEKAKINEMTPSTHCFFHISRETMRGGGVGFFVNKAFQIIKVSKMSVFESFELIEAKISIRSVCIKIITIYRPPEKSKRNFINEFTAYIDSLGDLGKILICGDFNLHIDNENDIYVSEFQELLETHNLVNSVNAPTSIGNHIIDLVIHNKEPNIVRNLEVEPDCSISPTHRMVIYELDIKKPDAVFKNIIFRPKNNLDPEKLIDSCVMILENTMMSCECDGSSQNANTNECTNCLTRAYKDTFNSRYDEICPITEKIIRLRESSKWFNNEIYEMKRKKRRLESKWKRNKTNQNRPNFTQVRNEYYNLIEKTKKKYYNNLFDSTKNPKDIHRHLDDLIGKKKEKILPENIIDHKTLTNNFVTYFEEKTSKINDSFPISESSSERENEQYHL